MVLNVKRRPNTDFFACLPASVLYLMKKLIKEVTELGAKVEVQEVRNKVKVEAMFRKQRQEHKEAKRSASMAKSYYQNMSRINDEPQFMDTKQ